MMHSPSRGISRPGDPGLKARRRRSCNLIAALWLDRRDEYMNV